MLATVRPQALGDSLRQDLEQRVALAHRARGESPAAVEAAIGSLDRLLEEVSTTDTAVHMLDEQVLARAGQTIEKDLAGSPLIAARLENTLGGTYRSLGLYDKAEQHAKRSVDIRRAELGPDHPDTLASMNTLGIVYDRQERYAEAETLLRETLDARRRVLGP